MDAMPLLELRGLVKRFGSAVAVDGVDLTGRAGEILALLGENGAGKTTLALMACGGLRPDAGEVRIAARRPRPGSPASALECGLGMMRQDFVLAGNLSVAEHIALAEGGRGPLHSPKAAAERAAAVSDAYNLGLDPRALVRDLSPGLRQHLEIAKLLARQARVLVFDEPTAMLAEAHVGRFLDLLRGLRESGKLIVLITHKLPEAVSVADRVVVMRQGKLIADVPGAGALDAAALARLAAGETPNETGRASAAREPGAAPRRAVFEGAGLSGPLGAKRPAFAGVWLRLRPGEITAVAAVAGNGQSELAECLAGLEPFASGEARLDGRILGQDALAQALRASCAHIPEDRRGEASVAAMTLAGNAALTTYRENVPGPWFGRRQAEQAAARVITDYQIVAPGPLATAASLSGGNLQKLIVARELGRGKELLIAREPTQGLDPAASARLRAALRQAKEHAAVVLFTADLALAAELADSVRVMYRGRMSQQIDPHAPGALETIKELMAGVEEEER
jgi:general nucleoside transport system ATP-binding protein